ncbi:MAG: glycosyltransferase family 39 protein [Sedimentisphaerales bacterium]|nr:glycosyltransferase family 39 protein [Sedimentisphaerales bacterium]
MPKRRKHASPSPSSSPPKSQRPLKSKLTINPKDILFVLVAVGIALVPFVYGKYLEFNNKDPFDGSMNIYAARCLLNGQKLGTDIYVAARPATLLVNIMGVALFGYSELGPKLIQMVLQIAALGLMLYTLRRLYGNLPAGVALILAAFYLSCPPYAKNGNVKEQYMISCMVISVCSLLLYLSGSSRLWLIVCGATAVNIYFFKPTGVSAIIAALVFLVLLRIQGVWSGRRMVRDILLMAAGVVLGSLPLAGMFLWQNQFLRFFKSFPLFAIKPLLAITIIGMFIYGIVRYRLSLYQRMIRPLRGVRWSIWAGGGIALILMYIGCVICLYIKYHDTSFNFIGEAVWARCLGWIRHQLHLAFQLDILKKSGYLAGSRSVADFQRLWNDVFHYYRSFVVPIGLSLAAIVWWLGALIKKCSRKGRDNVPASQDTAGSSGIADLRERVVLLFAVWWILDMLFIWISPRSYVQYFLPLNASAAMLTAYVLYHCRNRPMGFIGVFIAWVGVELFLRWIIPAESFPYIAWGPSELAGEGYWNNLAGLCWPLPVAIVLYLLLTGIGKVYRINLRTVQLIMIVILGSFWAWGWNEDNITKFKEEIEKVKKTNNGDERLFWEQIGDFIKTNSAPGDGLFVWGWMPGIYVQAQRYCPANYVADANLHTEMPWVLRRRIQRLVEQLKLNPPKYIVDPQFWMYPYYTNALFDLWPRWLNRQRIQFDLRMDQRYPIQPGVTYCTLEEVDTYQEHLLRQIEQFTFMVLTRPQRAGGALPEETAKRLARREKVRYEAVLPLVRFVMKNYEPVVDNAENVIFIFERKMDL